MAELYLHCWISAYIFSTLVGQYGLYSTRLWSCWENNFKIYIKIGWLDTTNWPSCLLLWLFELCRHRKKCMFCSLWFHFAPLTFWPSFLFAYPISLLTIQVQEKKVKRVSVMNLDTSQSLGSSTAIASTSSSKAPLPNGGCSDKFNCLNTNLSFPPGGYPSLRLPVVSYNQLLII